MPTVIDSLVLELGIKADDWTRQQRQLNEGLEKTRDIFQKHGDQFEKVKIRASDWVKQQRELREGLDKSKDAVKKHGDQVEKSSKDSGEWVGKLSRNFLELFAVVTGGRGLKDFAEWVTRSDAAIGRMSQNLGLSRQELYDWQHVSIQMGGSAEDATATFEKLNHAIQEIKRGHPTEEFMRLNELLGRVHSPKSAQDILLNRTPAQALLELSDALKNVTERERPFIFEQLKAIGLAPAVANAVLQGRDALRAQIAELEKHGKVSEQDTAASEQLIKAWDNMRASSDDLGRSIMTSLTPALLEALKGFTELFDAIRNRDLTEIKKDIRTPEEIAKEFPSVEEVNRLRAQHRSRRRLLGGAAPFNAQEAERDKIGIGDVSGAFWRGIKSIEDQSFQLLEQFKRIFRPILDWLEQKFGWLLHPFGGPAAAAGAGLAGLAPLGPGGIALPGALSPATPSWSGRPDARGAARGRLRGRVEGETGPGGGTRSYRNKNPGNIKYGPFAQAHGATGQDKDGFAIFPTIDSGEKAQRALWEGPKYANVPFSEALAKWSEHGYTPEQFGVSPTGTFAGLSEEQKQSFLAKQRSLEGWRGPSQRTSDGGRGSVLPMKGTAGAAFSEDLLGEGRGSPLIRQYLQTGGHGMDPVHVAWCAAYVGSWLSHHGFKSSPSLVATDYMKYGTPSSAAHPKTGDVLIQPRGHRPGETGGHVGIATGRVNERGQVEMLSGGGAGVKHTWLDSSQLVARHPVLPSDAPNDVRQRHESQRRLLSRDHPIGGKLSDMFPSEKQRWLDRIHHPEGPEAERADYIRRLTNKVFLSRPHIKRGYQFHPFMSHAPHAHASNVTNNHSNSDTKIGEIHIHTAATDAQGIARDIKPALQRTGMAMHANFSTA